MPIKKCESTPIPRSVTPTYQSGLSVLCRQYYEKSADVSWCIEHFKDAQSLSNFLSSKDKKITTHVITPAGDVLTHMTAVDYFFVPDQAAHGQEAIERGYNPPSRFTVSIFRAREPDIQEFLVGDFDARHLRLIAKALKLEPEQNPAPEDAR